MTTEQCRNFLEMLDDYLDRALGPEQQAEAERHLEECARCRHELEAHRRIIESLQQLEKVSAPGTLHAEVVARLQEQGERIPLGARIQELFSPRKLRIALEVAAVFIVVFIGWHIFWSPSLRLTVGEKRPGPSALSLYMADRAKVEESTPSAPASVSPQEAAVPTGGEASRKAIDKGLRHKIKVAEGVEQTVSRGELQKSLAPPAAPEVETEVAVPSPAPLQEGVTGGQERLQEQKEYEAKAAPPVASPNESLMLKQELEFQEVPAQPPAPVQSPVPELGRPSPESEKSGSTFMYQAYNQPVTPESKRAEEAYTTIGPEVTVKAKPEEKVAGSVDFLAPAAPAVTPELAGGAAAPRRQILQENGILVQGELPQPAVSPSAGISVGERKRDLGRNLAMEQQEQLRSKMQAGGIPAAIGTLIISAQPRRERGIFGTSPRVPELSAQAKLVEQILRQNRGSVISSQEGNDDVTIKSQLPASAYTRFVDQLEHKGFTVRREVVPSLARDVEGKIGTSKEWYRFYDEVQFRDQKESPALIPKAQRAPETAPLGLVGKQPGARLAPTPAAVPESSFSLTIIIQRSSPPEADTR
jgi:hypothetical protein